MAVVCLLMTLLFVDVVFFLQRDEEKKQARRDKVSRERERDRSREQGREREKDREREREKDRGKDKDKDRRDSPRRDREREKERGKSPLRERSRSPRRRSVCRCRCDVVVGMEGGGSGGVRTLTTVSG